MPLPLHQKRPMRGPGQLDRLITIESATVSATGGASDPDWDNPTTVATPWARKIVRRGTEVLDGKALQASASVVWELLYRTGITTKMRVTFGSDYYDIVQVDDQRKLEGFMELVCMEWGA